MSHGLNHIKTEREGDSQGEVYFIEKMGLLTPNLTRVWARRAMIQRRQARPNATS